LFRKTHRLNILSVVALIFNPFSFIFACSTDTSTNFAIASLSAMLMIFYWEGLLKRLKERHGDLQAYLFTAIQDQPEI